MKVARLCCLACVQTADCFSLRLGTHFCSQLQGVCHYRNGGTPWQGWVCGENFFFVFSSPHSPEVPFLTGQLEASVELPLG